MAIIFPKSMNLSVASVSLLREFSCSYNGSSSCLGCPISTPTMDFHPVI